MMVVALCIAVQLESRLISSHLNSLEWLFIETGGKMCVYFAMALCAVCVFDVETRAEHVFTLRLRPFQGGFFHIRLSYFHTLYFFPHTLSLSIIQYIRLRTSCTAIQTMIVYLCTESLVLTVRYVFVSCIAPTCTLTFTQFLASIQ